VCVDARSPRCVCRKPPNPGDCFEHREIPTRCHQGPFARRDRNDR